MNRAVFLDRDGTLIRNVPHNTDPSLVSLLPGVARGLRSLQDDGFRLILASNQPGVALGFFTEIDLMRITRRLLALLAEEDVHLTASYYCPHAAEGKVAPYAHPCHCRKPQPGLLLTAARDLGISLSDSWMIGDILHDVEAGNRAGCRTILIDNGNETEWVTGQWRHPHHILPDLLQAAGIIQKTSYAPPPVLH